MKKTLFILGSFLMFGVASAQTDSTRMPVKKQVKTEKVPQPKKDKSPSDSTDYNKNRGRTNPVDATDPKKNQDPAKRTPKTTTNPTGSPDTSPKTPMN